MCQMHPNFNVQIWFFFDYKFRFCTSKMNAFIITGSIFSSIILSFGQCDLLLLATHSLLIFRPSSVSVTILQDSSEGAWSRVQRAQLTRNKRNCSLDWSHWIEFFKHFKIDFNSVGNSSDIIFNWNIIEIINREIERCYSQFFIRLP